MTTTSPNSTDLRVNTPRYELRVPSEGDIARMREIVHGESDIDLELQATVFGASDEIDLACWNWMAIGQPNHPERVLGVQYFRAASDDVPFQTATAITPLASSAGSRLEVTGAALYFTFAALEVDTLRTRIFFRNADALATAENLGFEEVGRSILPVEGNLREFVNLELSADAFFERGVVTAVEMHNPHLAKALFGIPSPVAAADSLGR